MMTNACQNLFFKTVGLFLTFLGTAFFFIWALFLCPSNTFLFPSLFSYPLFLKIIWDGVLFQSFGLFHSLCASAHLPAQKKRFFFQKRLPYLTLTGIWLGIIPFFWIPLHPHFFQNLFPLSTSLCASMALFIFFHLCSIWSSLQIKSASSLIDPPAASFPPKLYKKGVYQYARHPSYFFLLLAFWMSPIYSLDRFFLNCFLSVYLIWGILFEESKLLKLHKKPYALYQKNTPVFFPKEKYLLTFLIGAVLGPIGDVFHVLSHTTSYPPKWVLIPYTPLAFWVPLLFGSASVAIAFFSLGNCIPFCPSFPTQNRSHSPVPSLKKVLFGFFFFVLTYSISGFLPWKYPAFGNDFFLGGSFFIFWLFFTHQNLKSFLFATLIALCGTAFEIMLTSQHVFQYLPPQNTLFGVPTWLPWLYAIAALSIQTYTAWAFQKK